MYIVIEIQTDNDGVVSTLVTTYEDINQAENKYHTVLAYAAASSLPMHAATMLTNNGNIIKSEHYVHSQE